jgi:hypothetical protein
MNQLERDQEAPMTDLIRREEAVACALDGNENCAEPNCRERRCVKAREVAAALRSIPAFEPVGPSEEVARLSALDVGEQNCQHDTGCDEPAALCIHHGGHDACAMDRMGLQGELSDARAEVATLREHLAKVCEAGDALASEVLDICENPFCDGPRCIACQEMKAAIAAARKAIEEGK